MHYAVVEQRGSIVDTHYQITFKVIEQLTLKMT